MDFTQILKTHFWTWNTGFDADQIVLMPHIQTHHDVSCMIFFLSLILAAVKDMLKQFVNKTSLAVSKVRIQTTSIVCV